MKASQFERIVEDQLKLCKEMLVDRAKQYATDADRLHNFKVAQGLLGGTPAQAALGMAAKHFVSVVDIVQGNSPTAAAMLDEKITDAINYLMLIKACLVEQKEAPGTLDQAATTGIANATAAMVAAGANSRPFQVPGTTMPNKP